jgi:hypothetical protein
MFCCILDACESANNTNRPENVCKNKLELVCYVAEQVKSLMFAVDKSNLYVVVGVEKIEVYSIHESHTERKVEEDIEMNRQDLTKPCCFTSDFQNNCLYLGDRTSSVIFEVLPKSKSIKEWIKIIGGEMQSVSPIKNGLAVLVTTKFITDKFWCGVVQIYEFNEGSDPRQSKRIDLTPCLLPHCVGAIDDVTIIVSWGLANHSGLAVVNCNKQHTELTGDFWMPGHLLYNRSNRMLCVTDAGKQQVGLWKLQPGVEWKLPEEPEVLHQWKSKNKPDYTFSQESAAQRPLRTAYYNDGKYQRIFIAFQNGQIDMYEVVVNSA